MAGPQIGSVSVTGLTYSDLGKILRAAREKRSQDSRGRKRSEEFFARSDNLAFAEKGVPAHTLAVAYEFSDYHEVGDEWQKVDYVNMAKVDRMIATALLMVAKALSAQVEHGTR